MAGLDSNPQPQQNPHQQNQTSTVFFSKGEEVEVSSEQEGFRGAWYLATILDFPTLSQPQSASEKKRKAIVQYKTLVTEDGPAPLLEQVDPQLIRPLPPQDLLKNGGVFQENEAIDASLRYGWWSGVVKKVLDRGARYMVYFDNPPDVLDFDAKDLRIHLDWVDGNWVRPEMQQQATGSVFSSGTEVEVNLEKDNVRDIWLPAVVVKENEDRTFLVKCQSSWNSDEAGTMKTIVDSLHIRPTPPHADRNYELLERVDAHYGIGWRSGVITKLLAGRRYNVFFKQGNEDRELSQSKIRPHMEWVDGKWISKKEVRILSDSRGQFGSTNNNKNPDVAELHKSSSASEDKTKEKTVSTSIRNMAEQSTHSGEKSAKKPKPTLYNGSGMRSNPSSMLIEIDAIEAPLSVSALQSRNIPIEMSSNEMLCGFTSSKTGVKDGNAVDVAVQGISEIDFKTKEIEVPFIMGLKATEGIYQDDKETLKLLRDQKKSLNDSAKDKNLERVGSSQRRKRGRPCKLTINSKASVTISQNSSRERSSEVSKTDFMSREVDAAAAAASKNVADDDQPLSTWFGGVHASASLGELRSSTGRAASGGSEAREKQAVAVESCTIDAKGNGTLVENQSVPFVKRSPVWKHD
ncbi:DUF724 domain-containing protein 2 isoform X2 [Populus alba x Populus x berolinensis]|nr:DUF724 domain-containing protein 2 isoform X2 [Populus alba x Populus x berolinensis]